MKKEVALSVKRFYMAIVFTNQQSLTDIFSRKYSSLIEKSITKVAEKRFLLTMFIFHLRD